MTTAPKTPQQKFLPPNDEAKLIRGKQIRDNIIKGRGRLDPEDLVAAVIHVLDRRYRAGEDVGADNLFTWPGYRNPLIAEIQAGCIEQARKAKYEIDPLMFPETDENLLTMFSRIRRYGIPDKDALWFFHGLQLPAQAKKKWLDWCEGCDEAAEDNDDESMLPFGEDVE